MELIHIYATGNVLWIYPFLGEKNTFKFEGGDSQVENIIFKSAALGSGASGKHVVEVSAVDASSEKVTAILCILNDQVSHNW